MKTKIIAWKDCAEDTLVDSRELAALLGCSVRHVQQLTHDGGLPPSIRIGRLRKWRVATVRAWLLAREAASAAGA